MPSTTPSASAAARASHRPGKRTADSSPRGPGPGKRSVHHRNGLGRDKRVRGSGYAQLAPLTESLARRALQVSTTTGEESIMAFVPAAWRHRIWVRPVPRAGAVVVRSSRRLRYSASSAVLALALTVAAQ